MINKKSKCPNGCKLPKQKKTLIQKRNGEFTFGVHDFGYCPVCGSMMSNTKNAFQGFFDYYLLNPKLNAALRLLYKGEHEAAVREAVVILEGELRDKSGLSLHGKDLAARALSFEYDKKEGAITKAPLIAVNDLDTESRRNEQESLMLMLMGFFQGPRNIFQHNSVGAPVTMPITLLLQVSYFLWQLNGWSLTTLGKWVKSDITYGDIYENMPRRIDRIHLRLMLWWRSRRAKTPPQSK